MTHEVENFEENIIISCVTKSKGPLTKIIRLDKETGEPIKDGSECSMYSGTIKQIPVSSPAGFAKMLKSRSTNQAITHGISEHKEAIVVTKNKVNSSQKNGTAVIARTKDYIEYPNKPGVILFDHDKPRDLSTGSKEALGTYSPEELLQQIAIVHPGVAKASYVSTPSTSSCIYDAEGKLLRGEGTGSHVYLFVKNALDIPRYMETLGKRLFLAGLGRIEISKAGSILKRTIIDLVVGSPERLDFVAGAVCEDGLVQKLPDPVVKNGAMIDTTELKDLTDKEEEELVDVVEKLIEQAKPNQDKVIVEYVDRESKKLSAVRNIDIEAAREVITSRRNHVLKDDDILFFAHEKGGIAVADVLSNGESFHGKSLADPLEPDYEGGSKTKAKFFWNDGSPKVHSFAHGSSNFTFERFKKEDSSSNKKEPDDDGQFPISTLKKLTKMNKKYAAVLLGSDFRIVKEGFDNEAKKNTVSFLKTTSFYNYYSNTKVPVYVGADKNVEYKEKAKVWMGWDERRTYEDVVFDPSEKCSKDAYNLFKGFPLKPKKGDWSLMRQHIFEIICDGNSEHFEYLMAWMSRAIQDPGGDKPGVAVVMKGGKGIGKGVFANYFGSIFGEAFLPIADSESFTGRFNMHLSKSLVVFLDEAVWGGDKKAEGKLKQLITEPTILFEPKGIDSLTMRNYINVLIASNEDWVVPATGDERRFFVLQPSEAFQKKTAYFAKIIKEQRSGGPEAMMYDLLEYDRSGVDLRDAPFTVGLIEQVQVSLPSVPEFWHTVISREYLLTDRETGKPVKTEVKEDFVVENGLWPLTVYKYEVYHEYLNWCRSGNERYPKNTTHFWRETWDIWDGGLPKRIQIRDDQGKLMDVLRIPTIEEAQKAFTETTKIEFFNEQVAPSQETLPFQGQF